MLKGIRSACKPRALGRIQRAAEAIVAFERPARIRPDLRLGERHPGRNATRQSGSCRRAGCQPLHGGGSQPAAESQGPAVGWGSPPGRPRGTHRYTAKTAPVKRRAGRRRDPQQARDAGGAAARDRAGGPATNEGGRSGPKRSDGRPAGCRHRRPRPGAGLPSAPSVSTRIAAPAVSQAMSRSPVATPASACVPASGPRSRRSSTG